MEYRQAYSGVYTGIQWPTEECRLAYSGLKWSIDWHTVAYSGVDWPTVEYRLQTGLQWSTDFRLAYSGVETSDWPTVGYRLAYSGVETSDWPTV